MSTLLQHSYFDDEQPRTSFPAVVQAGYGEPSEILRLQHLPAASLQVGPNDVLLHVTMRPVHRSDLHRIRASKKAGNIAPIPSNKPMSPGSEGVGVIVQMGAAVRLEGRFSIGQRVAFLHPGSWSVRAVVPSCAIFSIPDDIADQVAAQLLVHGLTAQMAIASAEKFLGNTSPQNSNILQSGATSAVGFIVAHLVLERQYHLIRLTKTPLGAAALANKLPGGAILTTKHADWRSQVAAALGTGPLDLVLDNVGGELLTDYAKLLKDGGTVINFGWLGTGEPEMDAYAPRGISMIGISVNCWFACTQAEQRSKQVDVVIELARRKPELFTTAAQYSLADFSTAIAHATRPGKFGTVLMVD